MKILDNFIQAIEKSINNANKNTVNILSSIEEAIEGDYNNYANDNPIKDISSSLKEIVDEDYPRQTLIIQNIGVNPCYLGFGKYGVLSSDNFHVVLAPDTYGKYGNGGSIELKNWHGKVFAICGEGMETQLSVLEY